LTVQLRTGIVRRLEALSVSTFLGIVAVLSIFTLVNFDIGFHLASGAYIWANGEIPTHDPFSYIAEGRPWVDSHWLFQLLVSGLYEGAGATGLVLFRVAAVVSTFAITLAIARKRAGLPIALLVSLLAALVSYQRFIVRPGLLTLLFLAVFIYAVDDLARRPKRYLIALPLLQVVWVNTHGLWVLGLGYLGLHLLGAAVQSALQRRRPGAASAGQPPCRRQLILLALLLALCCVTSLANANGLDGITYPLTLLTEIAYGVPWFPQLTELKPPLGHPITHALKPEVFYRGLLVISLLSALINWKKIRLSDLFPFVVFGLLSLRAFRNMPLFAVVAVPFVAENIRAAWRRALEAGWVRPRDPRTVALATAASMLVLAGGVTAAAASNTLYQQFGWNRRFGFAESEFYPSGVVDYLRGVEGRFFNDSSSGGYLMWKLHPEKQVATDGRWEIYGEFIPKLRAARRNPRTFSQLASQHDIRTIVLLRRSADYRLMRGWLAQSREFVLTRQTRNAVIYEKRRAGRESKRKVP